MSEYKILKKLGQASGAGDWFNLDNDDKWLELVSLPLYQLMSLHLVWTIVLIEYIFVVH